MVAALKSCIVSGSIIPIGRDGQPLPLLIAKIASDKPLTVVEMAEVRGFRQLLDVSSTRRSTAKSKVYLALRLVLKKDDYPVSDCKILDVFREKMSIVNNNEMLIPSHLRSTLGEWSVAVGYSAIKEKELMPKFIRPILDSLPYVFDDENVLRLVVSDPVEIRPDGERTRRIDVVAEMSSGRNRPDEI